MVGEICGALEGIDLGEIMHSVPHANNGITIVAANSATGVREFIAGTNMSLSLGGDNEEELVGYYNKLAEGGSIQSPLKKESWGDTFSMYIDKFGTFLMVNIVAQKAWRIIFGCGGGMVLHFVSLLRSFARKCEHFLASIATPNPASFYQR